jgi:penicillin amidase
MLPFLVSLLWGSFAFSQTYSCHANYRELDIVQVEVKSADEFYYCFGYHHGADRAWMMDYFRRSAEGRNAEVLGLDHLKSDLMMRLLDVKSLAERIYQDYPEPERKKLEAYARGVNAGFEIGKKAREFTDLGYGPETWKPVHTLEVLLLQAFDQTRKTFTTDWEQEKFKARWKDRAATLMDNDHAAWENTILKKGEYEVSSEKAALIQNNHGPLPLWSNFPTVFGKESGSNNWVVSAKKSETGKAMLANDPHLDLKTPLFWYWIHLKSPEGEVIGASLPGVPIIASGTNGKVAWGLTNAYINTADAVYLNDLRENEIETIRPVVWIKLWFLKLPFFFKSFERTKSRHPVLPLALESDEKIFLRWTGFELTASDITPMFALLSVKDVADADQLLKKLGLPSWNFVFADSQGDIGFRVVGNIYRENKISPYGIRRISYQELKSTDYLSPEERPHVMKPRRGYVYSANNRHWPSDSKFSGGRGYSFSFRGNRIDELLQPRQNVQSFKAIQCDRQAVDAKYFVPKFLKMMEMPELRNWNYETAEDNKSIGIYRRFMELLMQKWDVNEYGLWRLLDSPTESTRSEMSVIYQKASSDIHDRPWGEIHRLAFAHLSKNKNWVFAPEVGAAGDNHTVDPGTSKWNDERKLYEHTSGASMRMIIEMEKRPRIHLVFPGFNRDYTMKTEKNPWDDWKACRYTSFTM